MTQPRPAPPTLSGPTRRQVLRGGAVAGVGLGVALSVSACAGGSQGAQSAAPATLDQPLEVPKGDVPVGGGVIKSDDRVVVTQPTTGRFHAFSAVCTHQGCLVSSVRQDAIVCACHMSLFDPSDGHRISGPARAGLPTVRVTEDGDNLRVG